MNTAQGFEAVHAAVLTEESYVFVPWPGMAGASEMALDASRELGTEVKDRFAHSYRLAVPIEGEDALREGCYRDDCNDA